MVSGSTVASPSGHAIARLQSPCLKVTAYDFAIAGWMTAANQFYTVWADGSDSSIAADRDLFARAGVETSSARILHFYPLALERQLESLEREFAGRQPSEIRRTHFCMRKTSSGFEFFVSEQSIR